MLRGGAEGESPGAFQGSGGDSSGGCLSLQAEFLGEGIQLAGRRQFAMGLIEDQADGRRPLSPEKANPDAAKTNCCEKQHLAFHRRFLVVLLRPTQRYHDYSQWHATVG